MRAILTVLVLAAVCSVAFAENLPSGFNSAEELASVLANEPASAQRFMESSLQGCAAAPGGCGGVTADTISFSDGGASASGSFRSRDQGLDLDTSEFDSQLEQITADQKKVKEELKEALKCAERVEELKAEQRSLEENKLHLEKEKDKAKLQKKLEQQLKDLSEINRMSRALRTKFNELKNTQRLIKTRLTGTRSSLSQLDSEAEDSPDDLKDSAESLGSEMDAMHAAQAKVLAGRHKRITESVKKNIKTANEAHYRTMKEEQDD